MAFRGTAFATLPKYHLNKSDTLPNHRRYFFQKFGITERLLERCLGEALSAGGDYADLYFESVAATSIGVDEQIVKTASQGVSSAASFFIAVKLVSSTKACPSVRAT